MFLYLFWEYDDWYECWCWMYISDSSQLPSGVDTTGVIVDVELEEGELDDHHDSQMMSQLISEGEDDEIDQTRSKLPKKQIYFSEFALKKKEKKEEKQLWISG